MTQIFESRDLWHRRSGGPRRFLHDEHTLPAAVLAALAVDRPGDLYDELVAAAVADIHAAPIT
jgi:hypothetical protein